MVYNEQRVGQEELNRGKGILGKVTTDRARASAGIKSSEKGQRQRQENRTRKTILRKTVFNF